MTEQQADTVVTEDKPRAICCCCGMPCDDTYNLNSLPCCLTCLNAVANR